MGAIVNEIMAEVADHGARLRVERGNLAFKGEISESLKARIREHKEELVRELSWDEERAYTMLEEVAAYVNGISVSGAELLFAKDEVLSTAIDRAFVEEDMWAFRVARRAWAGAWIEAVAEAKERAA